MDKELINRLGLTNSRALNVIEYTQKCIDIFEKTIRVTGITSKKFTTQATDSSKVVYQYPSPIKY